MCNFNTEACHVNTRHDSGMSVRIGFPYRAWIPGSWMYRTDRMNSSIVWPRVAYITKTEPRDIPSRKQHLLAC